MIIFFLFSLIFNPCFFQTTCFGITSTNQLVCSNHGNCLSKDLCKCDRYYSGPKCSLDSSLSSRTTWKYVSSVPTFSFEDDCDYWGSTDVTIFWSHPDLVSPTEIYDTKQDIEGPYGDWWGIKTNYDLTARFCMEEDESLDYECMGCGNADCRGISTSTFPSDSDNYVHAFNVNMTENGLLFFNLIVLDCPNYNDLCTDANAKFDLDCRFRRTQSNDVTFHYCYGYPQDDPRVCTDGNGVCIGENNCQCDNFDYICENCVGNWIGVNCSECATNWVGVNCSDCPLGNPEENCVECNGIPRGNGNECWFGTCSDDGVCVCPTLFFGPFCNGTCHGIYPNETDVCSGNGDCKEVGCECNSGFYGDNCNISMCYGILSNETEVCNNDGVCIDSNCFCNPILENIQEDCSCLSGYYGDYCNISMCYGILSNESEVCNGDGECIDSVCFCNPILENVQGDCSCLSGYYGDFCNISMCYGILSNESDVCNSDGACIDLVCVCNPILENVQGDCSCLSGYYGDFCNISICYGIFSNESEVCNGDGECIDSDCVCNPLLENIQGDCSCLSRFFGLYCTISECFGILSNSSLVCNENGTCVNRICDCQYDNMVVDCSSCSEGYEGEFCQIQTPGPNSSVDPFMDALVYIIIGVVCILFITIVVTVIIVICLYQFRRKWKNFGGNPYKLRDTSNIELQKVDSVNVESVPLSTVPAGMEVPSIGSDYIPPPEIIQQKEETVSGLLSDCCTFFLIALAVVAIILGGLIAIPIIIIYFVCKGCCEATGNVLD